ncbi:PEP-CTERM/exosortase system-associated acyltransferase [Rheinheimera sp. MMS21-TC3]|uniref:PEP-CTERM/exosortase system-associated acyltransferase n=1 Tax=Rheinheimera sp. MMS21-TC3 TaxID=3072790 RepID=UPI0028C4FB15|nr:PEP-CTERM/exosortase system-associated acyltransferase [Rheinheimera sp. MMS21-TC3]WNO61968.1 PEP-CTERM/exosortase system-associated acyltransferase [Rheinheimera sp. MMS21-TC3]
MTSMPTLQSRLIQPKLNNVELQTKKEALNPALQLFPYFFTARLAANSGQQTAIYRLRHQVYCEELNFEPIRASGLEHDEFDSRAIHCFINHTSTNVLAGTVRLITANNGEDKLPIEYYCNSTTTQLSPKHFAPSQICEISRLAVPANIRRRIIVKDPTATPLNQLLNKFESECHSSVAVALYLIATLISVEKGKYHAYVMIEPALARILSRIGINFQKIGDSINFNGKRAPYYLDMRTVSTTLKPNYLSLRALLAEQLGLHRPHKQTLKLIKPQLCEAITTVN